MNIAILPFKWLWNASAFVLRVTGRLLTMLLGILSVIMEVLYSLSGIGAITGISLILFGITLVIRGFFKGRLDDRSPAPLAAQPPA
jgi:VIT1/CCC1 family predicted Fe2+/Mn2+ transporter